MNWFGKKENANETSKRAIIQLRETLEGLEKRGIWLEKKIEKETEKAKEFVRLKNQKDALNCLRTKKGFEAQLEAIFNQRLTLQQQSDAIESGLMSAEVVKALTTGKKALEAINSSV